jgi:hypothetical protein
MGGTMESRRALQLTSTDPPAAQVVAQLVNLGVVDPNRKARFELIDYRLKQ